MITTYYATSEDQLRSLLTREDGTYNFFRGRIKVDNEDRIVNVSYYNLGNDPKIRIEYFFTYWGEVKSKSYCRTVDVAVKKISKFLNLNNPLKQ